METIKSVQNSSIKLVSGLTQKSSLRKKSNVFVIEGKRELELAIKAGYKIDKIFCCPALFKSSHYKNWFDHHLHTFEIVEVSDNVYEKISYRKNTEGVIALVRKRSFELEELTLKRANPLVLVAENIEKPGNIGAMLRTADAANIDCLLIAEPKTDIFNPNIIRSSVGGFFSVPIGVGSNEEVLAFLMKNQITTYAASLDGSSPYEKIDYTTPSALIVGTESTGLSDFWIREVQSKVKIPMLGKVDSMNVSVASAILLFEALRQRNFYR